MGGIVKMFDCCKGFVILASVICSLFMFDLRLAQADMKPSNFNNEHRSLLKVHRVAPGGETRHVKIGLNKSLVVELPRDVRDVLVSNPEFIDAVLHSSRRAYLIGKKVGEGNAFFFDKEGNRLLTIEISISRDMSALEGMYSRVLRDSKIKVDTVNEHIVLTGSVRSPADATKALDIAARFVEKKDQVINLLTSGGNEQVALKVTVAEIKRSVAKKLGINLQGLASGNGLTFSTLTKLSFPNVAQLLPGVFPQALVPGVNTSVLPTISGVTNQLGYTNGSNSIAGVIDALERNGVLRTLASPNLTAVSGETAKFLAGGEFPIPVSQDDDGIKVTFKPFGVSLAFTPVVMDEKRISLKIATEVSELTNRGAVTLSAITIPAIEVRRASTMVELSSGGSIVMAGLISDKTKHNIDDLPEIKRLPILGALFRSRDFVRDETELVVIVTPYLVNETARHKLATPDQALGLPSDRKAFFKGHLNRYDEHAARRRGQRPVTRSWGLKDFNPASYKEKKRKQVRSRRWQTRTRREGDELGFIVE